MICSTGGKNLELARIFGDGNDCTTSLFSQEVVVIHRELEYWTSLTTTVTKCVHVSEVTRVEGAG